MTHEPVRDDEMPPDPFDSHLEEPTPEVAEARAKVITAFGQFLLAAQECINIDSRSQLHQDHWGWVRPRSGLQLEVDTHAGPNIITVVAQFPMDVFMASQPKGDTDEQV